MKKKLFLLGLATLLFFASPRSGDAFQGPGNVGFLPFGFYQPYGVRYSSSVRTPPHFSLNPPVYYGQRYSRPYGASPFASPPLLGAGADYRVRPSASQPRVSVVMPGEVICNPYVNGHTGEDWKSPTVAAVGADDMAASGSNAMNGTDHWLGSVPAELGPQRIGPVRSNPFVITGNLAADSRSRETAVSPVPPMEPAPERAEAGAKW